MLERNDLLTAEEVAELLKVSLPTIRRWTSNRFLPHVKLGLRMVRYRKDATEKWLGEKDPLCVYIDEFQAFGTKNFLNALARGRSAGLCITIAHQSIGDLKAVSPEFAQQVIDLTNTKIFLRVNDPETASLFSDSLGTYETVEITKQIQLGGALNRKSKLMGSQKLIEKYRIHPSEIQDLKTGEAVVKTPREHGKISLCPYFLNLSQEDVALPMKKREVEIINQGG